jgi:plastocyanin
MKRVAVALVAAASLFALMHTAAAVTHQATVGNYFYEDDTAHDQTKLVVRQGDQITFTVRQAAVPGHTVDVDALNIHSPNLSLGQTFTTPVLNKPGNFYLYCRPHEDRGHHTRLIVVAAAAKTPLPKPTPAPRRTASPPHVARPATRTPAPATATPAPAPTPTASLTPVGVGTAPSGDLSKPVPTNPNSLNALTGRKITPVSWTRSLWWLLIASVALIAIGAFAFRRALAIARTPPPPPPARKKPAPTRKR